MSAPLIKGWCPGAHRPMLSGDGLIVRVRPRLGRLSVEETRLICDLAEQYGSGMIDVTSRANLQLRGVSEDSHPDLLEALLASGLVDKDVQIDKRRNIVATPFWRTGDLTDRLGAALEARLGDLPDLPAKVGFALDTGPAPILRGISADFRIETGEAGLILRAEGARLGCPVTEYTAIQVLIEMVNWFVATGGAKNGRMGLHLTRADLPSEWQTANPLASGKCPNPGITTDGCIWGVPFGQTNASDLVALIESTSATHLRVLPWRMLFLENSTAKTNTAFFSAWDDPVLKANACPGAPLCPQATVPTRPLARALARRIGGTLHVSGCAKGCARPSASALTIVGCDGSFDVVRDGNAWDVPSETGLSDIQILERFT